jgi:gas vesicle protein
MRKFFSFFLGVFSGGLVGAAAALLFAPAPGNDLRSQVTERYHNIQDEVRSAAVARRAELERELENLRAPRKA